MTAIALLRQAREHVPKDLRFQIDAVLLAEESDAFAIDEIGECAWLTLTPRQQDLIRAFVAHRRQHNVSPTMQELADAMGISKVSVYGLILNCINRGVMRKTNHIARGLELVTR